MKRIALLFLIAFILLNPAGALAAPMKVFVSISPQKYFVEKIGGDLVDVTVMVPPGANPHNYEPKPRQMVDLSKARIYFALGVNFEDVWLDKIASANPDMKIVHTEKGIVKIPMETHHHHDHEESPGKADSDEDHHHQGILDPHVWTSPVRVKIMAENIYEALVGIDPDNKKTYEDGRRNFMKELDGLDSEFRKILAHSQGMKFMVFHPAWGYLAHDYGLVQIPVEVEGKEPKPAQLKELIEHAREEGVRIIFVQPQMSTKSASAIAGAIGGQVVPADPLAEDWGRNLTEQVKKFKEALK